MSYSDFGYQVFPHTSRNGVIDTWNAVVYDLTRWRDLPSGQRCYRFVDLVKPQSSKEKAREASIRLCRQCERARLRGSR